MKTISTKTDIIDQMVVTLDKPTLFALRFLSQCLTPLQFHDFLIEIHKDLAQDTEKKEKERERLQKIVIP